MDKETWIACIKGAVEDVADVELQETAWRGKGDLASSPGEVYCILFDDFVFEEFLQSDMIKLTERQKKLGNKLVEAMDEYSPWGEELPEVEYMLADPAWHRVRQVAAEFLAVL